MLNVSQTNKLNLAIGVKGSYFKRQEQNYFSRNAYTMVGRISGIDNIIRLLQTFTQIKKRTNLML
jgi:hypothetical protein